MCFIADCDFSEQSIRTTLAPPEIPFFSFLVRVLAHMISLCSDTVFELLNQTLVFQLSKENITVPIHY